YKMIRRISVRGAEHCRQLDFLLRPVPADVAERVGIRTVLTSCRSQEIMEDTERTLVIVLSMHRSGSSLTANILKEQGLSLGPWALYPPHPSNPHGHFEAIPILELTLAVQTLLYGFPNDIPETPEAMAGFL